MTISLPNKANLNDDQLKEVYRKMVLIRLFEEKVDFFFAKGMIHGTTHLCVGEEATAAGSGAVLKTKDWITATHRGHGQTIAKGTPVHKMMAELFGKKTGYCKGKGGSMHIADFGVGMLGANGVVAAGIPIATGAAQALKLQGRDSIVACFFGDGAINRGPFLEGLNWARVHELPVLFVCEDNRYSATTATGTMTAGDGAAVRALSLDIPAVTVDGNDAEASRRGQKYRKEPVTAISVEGNSAALGLARRRTRSSRSRRARGGASY